MNEYCALSRKPRETLRRTRTNNSQIHTHLSDRKKTIKQSNDRDYNNV